ncbi:MAG: carbohydrate ABC transporter permease [Christensenellales bacterium]|jgi:multiple sugar transport system permease protein|nr:carbohydrate ABC transporter permease [Clostridiales bacterium]
MNVSIKPQTKTLLLRSVVTAIMFVASLLMLVPFIWMLSTSFKGSTEVFNFPIEWIPKQFYFKNYSHVWLNEHYPFYHFFGNSIYIALMALLGQIIVSATAAYAFAKVNFRFKNIIFVLYLSTMMIPRQATLVPYFALFRVLKIYNTHWALILPAWVNMTSIFLLRQFFLSIPEELSESAKLDGASHFRILLQIIMPLAMPAVSTLVVLGFVSVWNDYANPLVFITKRDLYTITLGIAAYIEDDMTLYNLIMVAATCAIAPIVIVYLCCQKYFIQGIATTGVKG